MAVQIIPRFYVSRMAILAVVGIPAFYGPGISGSAVADMDHWADAESQRYREESSNKKIPYGTSASGSVVRFDGCWNSHHRSIGDTSLSL